MNASGSGDGPLGDNWVDAIAGRLSPTGENSFREALRQFADQAEWQGDAGQRTRITEQLRTLTNAAPSTLADCIPTATRELALEHALITARRYHQSQHRADVSGGDTASPAKCLCMVGSDHGRSIVARMASGKPTLRGSEWPLLPGFAHAPADRFIDRIDSSTAVALVSPVDFSGVGQPLTADWWAQCRQRCDETGTRLIVDQGDFPPAGNGYFFSHEMTAGISADAVILSAGLVGELPGGLLVLSESMASHVDESVLASDLVGHLVSAALSTLIETDALATEADAFAIALAERIATRGCVRDLHASGHTVILELDVESRAWIEQSAKDRLRAQVCTDHSVLFQPPLMMTADQQSTLIARIDAVLAGLEGTPERQEDGVSESIPDELAGLTNATRDDKAIEEDEFDKSTEDKSTDDELDDQEERDKTDAGGEAEEDDEIEQDETELENNELDEFESNEETEKF